MAHTLEVLRVESFNSRGGGTGISQKRIHLRPFLEVDIFNLEINRSVSCIYENVQRCKKKPETAKYLQIGFFVSQFCYVFQRDVRVLQNTNKIKKFNLTKYCISIILTIDQ